MTESGPSETYNPTSNDLLLLLTSQHKQNGFTYGTVAQTASDVQNVDNSPAISMGPYLIISGQTELLRSISVYSERGKSREQVRLLYRMSWLSVFGRLWASAPTSSMHKRGRRGLPSLRMESLLANSRSPTMLSA